MRAMNTVLASLLFATAIACGNETRQETQADVAAARGEAAKDVGEASREAAEDTAKARREAAETAARGAYDVERERAEGAYKIEIERCEALVGDLQAACKDAAEKQLESAKRAAEMLREQQMQ